MNKRVLLTITGLHFQNDEGAKKRIEQFISSYSRIGYSITVLLFFSPKSIRYLFQAKKYLNPGATWILLPNIPISKDLYVSRLSRFYVKSAVALLSRIKNYKIIQAEGLGDILKWASNKSFLITDFHGDLLSEAKFVYENKKPWFFKLITKWQEESIKYSDHVICVSEKLTKQIESNTNTKIENSSVISCAVDLDFFNRSDETHTNESSYISLGYLGGLQKWQNIESIIIIFKKLYELNGRYKLFIYTNDDRAEVCKMLKGVPSDSYQIKSLSYSEVPSHLKSLDAGFLIRSDLNLNQVSSPTKIGEYLACGVPIICTKYSGDYHKNTEMLKEVFVLEDIEITEDELKGLNQYLSSVKESREYYKDLCLEAAKKRSWDNEFIKFYDKINIRTLNAAQP